MLTLTGILKNVLLIFASVMIWHTSITPLQFFGYAIALLGLLVYSESLRWDHVAGFGVFVRGVWESPSLDETRLSPLVRKTLMLAMGVLITGMLVVGFSYDTTAATPAS